MSAVWPHLRHGDYHWKVLSSSSIDRWAFTHPETELIYESYHCSAPEAIACGSTEVSQMYHLRCKYFQLRGWNSCQAVMLSMSDQSDLQFCKSMLPTIYFWNLFVPTVKFNIFWVIFITESFTKWNVIAKPLYKFAFSVDNKTLKVFSHGPHNRWFK